MQTGSNKRDRLLLEIVIVFFWASEYCHSPYFTPYLNSLSLSATLVGMIVSCYGFTQMLVRIPLGVATDATGAYKKIIVAGLAFTTVSSLGLFLTTNVVGIFFFRMLAGVAASTWIATTVTYMSLFSDGESVRASTRLNALNNGGKLLAFVLGGVAASLIGYRVTLFLSFAVGVIGLVFSVFVTPPTVRKTPPTVSRLVSMLISPAVMGPALLMAVQQMILHATVFSFTSTLAKNVGAPTYMLSVLSAVYTVVQIGSAKIITSPAFQKLNRHGAILLGFGFLIGSVLLLGTAQNVWVVLAAQIICAFGSAVLASLLLAECVKGVSQGERSTAVGIFQAVYGIGMTVGPALFGRCMDVASIWVSCLVLSGAAAVLVAVICLFSWTNRSAALKSNK